MRKRKRTRKGRKIRRMRKRSSGKLRWRRNRGKR